jgi:hypothetical protein
LPPSKNSTWESLAVLGPLILPTDLILFLWCEIILNIECLADFLGRLALDHVGYRLATDVEQGFDVKVVCGLGKQKVSKRTVSERRG